MVVAWESEAIAELRRVLGRRLATFRDAAGLTQGQLGARVFVDRTTITHLEGGTGSKGSRDLWKALDTALDARGALLQGLLELAEARERSERHDRTAALAEVRAQADRLRDSHVWTVPIGLAGDSVSHDSAGVSLAAIQAMSDAFQRADRKLGGGVLYGQLVRYIRSEIAPVLLDPPRHMSATGLFSAAASFAEGCRVDGP